MSVPYFCYRETVLRCRVYLAINNGCSRCRIVLSYSDEMRHCTAETPAPVMEGDVAGECFQRFTNITRSSRHHRICTNGRRFLTIANVTIKPPCFILLHHLSNNSIREWRHLKISILKKLRRIFSNYNLHISAVKTKINPFKDTYITYKIYFGAIIL